MKAVLLSIKPKYCERIANRKKTIEVRKTRPKDETPFKCYIYCTQVSPYNKSIRCHYKASDGNYSSFVSAKVIGEFICDRIEYLDMDSIGVGFMENGKFIYIDDLGWNVGLSLGEYVNYSEGRCVYGWHISDLKIYDKPKELSEFRKPGGRQCVSDNGRCCKYLQAAPGDDPNDENTLSCIYGEQNCPYEHLNRPPRSWWYVEE